MMDKIRYYMLVLHRDETAALEADVWVKAACACLAGYDSRTAEEAASKADALVKEFRKRFMEGKT